MITVDPRVHQPEELAAEGQDQAEGIEVHRTFCLDVRRDLSIRGKFPGVLALPDRWWTWRFSTVGLARRLAAQHGARAIFSTYPQASAHLIGHALQRKTGLPWVADFRDPMVHGPYPEDWLTRRVLTGLEARTVRAAKRVVLTTPSARELYRQRYPDLPPSHWQLIHNGYDEQAFAAVEQELEPDRRSSQRFELLHSGLLYRGLRDPTTLFQAIGELKREAKIDSTTFRLVLRACGSEQRHRDMCQAQHIEDLVAIEPGVPYQEALAEMFRADGLLLLQGRLANRQIPAKVYEYLRAKRPLLSVLHPEGDTAALLDRLGVATIADIESTESIKNALVEFLSTARMCAEPMLGGEALSELSRAGGAAQLAALLDDLV